MKLNVKHAALALVEVSAVLALAACGGGSGGEDTAAQSPLNATHDVSTQGVQTGVYGNSMLNVTVTGGGTVTSTPNGIDCTSAGGASCGAPFARKTSVTVTATPATGYSFAGWSGMCTNTKADCTAVMAAGGLTAGATFTKDAGGGGGGGGGATAPMISYTDTISAPTTGGENNRGGYLSIFGSNFGPQSGLGTNTKVFIGGQEVANYRYLGASKVGAKLGLQQLTVQVGNLGGAAVGTALPIKVVVNGVASNVDQTFTPTAGHVIFLALNGSDTSAVIGDITHPFRYFQNMNTGKGAYFAMGAGDQVVIRGGNWSDTNGVDTSWMKFGMNSSARNGTAKAYIHITAYPGPVNGNAIEDVHYTTPSGTSGGIQGPWSSIAGTSGEYIAVSNLRFDIQGGANRDAAPVNFQYTAGPWRVVNNEIGPWVAGNSPILNAAGVSGHGNGNVVMGNHIHDIQGLADQQNHGIYADTTAQNWNVGYNWIHDMTGGSLIQFNDNEGGAGSYQLPHGGIWQGFTGIQIHHNWLENAVKYGVNFNDQGSVKAGTYDGKIWNNVIIGTQLPPLRINSTQPTQTLWFAFNTLYNDMTLFSGSGNGYVRQEGWASQSGVQNVFFNNIFAFGPNTVAGTDWFANVGGTLASKTTYSFKNNLYFANGQSPAAPSTIGDTEAIVSNPLFVNPAQSNFQTQATSPARKATNQTLPNGFLVNDDITRLMKRVQGQTTDIGAYVGS